MVDGIWVWFQPHCNRCGWIGSERSFPGETDALELVVRELDDHRAEQH